MSIAIDDDLAALAQRVSNRGRWGDDDELGTLNLIDDSTRLRALQEVTHGRTYSIARDVDFAASARNPRPAKLAVIADPESDERTVRDELSIAPHGLGTTHVDAVGHCFYDGEVYNGRPVAAILSASGLAFGSVMAQRDGVLTRGVLLDVASARGVDRLEAGDAVTADDLTAAEALSGTTVRGGDAIFVRVGTGIGADPVFGSDGEMIRAGLSAECLEWMHSRSVAVYSGDCVDVFPSPFAGYPDFLHQVALGRMGLVFLDCPDVELLRTLCEREGRSTFLLIYAPLRIPGGSGSPVNPLVVF